DFSYYSYTASASFVF
nr:immunoglobulin light chain junction region [Macaca mulatta]